MTYHSKGGFRGNCPYKKWNVASKSKSGTKYYENRLANFILSLVYNGAKKFPRILFEYRKFGNSTIL